MKKRRVVLMIYAVAFILILAAPILTINRIPGRASETENRYLATFPPVFNDEGHLNDELKSGFETWLGDNIGFRSDFVKLAGNVRLKLFHQSTSDRVEIGKDGWYFYTPDHNIEIATGEFVLTEEMMEDIAQKQQRISDWYASQGIKYVLALTPAKTTVYPEYIASGDYGIMETPCDQLEVYLNEHTNVHVVNCKRNLVENKSAGQLFLKHDTHVTQMGAYYTYLAITEKLSELGDTIQEFPVTFSEMVTPTGDLSSMLGTANILGPETVPEIKWESNLTEINNGAEFEELEKIQQSYAIEKGIPVLMYENSAAKNGTLLIYGDSIWETKRCLPQLMGENYRSMVVTRLRSINMELDELVQPNTVIYNCGERQISSLLLNPTTVPDIMDSLPDLPQTTMITAEEYGKWVGKQGIYLERYNDKRVEDNILIDSTASFVKLRGWAADFCHDAPFSELYLQVGDALVLCEYNYERPDVADHFHKDSLLKTEFRVTFPASFLKDGGITEVSFIGVSADGQYLYEPVTYQLVYS